LAAGAAASGAVWALSGEDTARASAAATLAQAASEVILGMGEISPKCAQTYRPAAPLTSVRRRLIREGNGI